MYTSTVLGEGKGVLFREVSLIRVSFLERFHCIVVIKTICSVPLCCPGAYELYTQCRCSDMAYFNTTKSDQAG